MKVVAFEESRRMPRLSHTPLAVIHPVHSRNSRSTTRPSTKMKVMAKAMKLSTRKVIISTMTNYPEPPPVIRMYILHV